MSRKMTMPDSKLQSLQPCAQAGGPEWSKDRIGVVFFDSTAQHPEWLGEEPPRVKALMPG